MKKVNDTSREVNNTSKRIALFLGGKKIIQIFSIIVILLFFPVAKFIHDKVCDNHNGVNEGATDSLDNKNLTQGTIYTDVENSKKEDEKISKYTLGDGYSEVENSTHHNNSVSNGESSSSYIDYSSLSGSSITILEGDSFEPITTLNLNATDKDGSSISDKIIITENNVNVEKAGYYTVSASVKLSSGQTLQRVFSVQVKAKKLDVTVNSFKAIESKVTKGEKVNFTLDITSSKSYVKASAVNINGKDYSVYPDGDNLNSKKQKYKIEASSGDLIGAQDYKISYIRMSDNSIINVDKTATVEILKSEAKVKDFKYETNSAGKNITMKFNLEDIDNSASNLRLEVYKDNELVATNNLDRKELYEEKVMTYTNGIYEIKVLADINLNSTVNEENTILNKVLLSESINVTNVDETSLTGTDIEIVEGDEFNINLLNIEARDVDGEDITDKVIIRYNNVNNNIAGSYKVIVNVTNKKNRKIEKTFKVTVVKPVITEESDNNNDLETDLSTTFLLDRNSNEVKASRSLTNGTISGNATETLDANVTITGNITKADGTAASGKIQVEVPTSLAFSIDQAGNFNGTVFNIKNSSDTEISVSVGQFKETKSSSGITVRPLSQDLTNMDRSNVHLYLQGDILIDLGETLVSDKELIAIQASDSKTVQLLGNAGKSSGTEVDTNGASEEFNLVFKIKKR